MNTTDLRALALATDTALAKTDRRIMQVRNSIKSNEARLTSKWYAHRLDEVNAAIAADTATLVELQAEFKRLNQIWIDNGRWTRTFVVPGGHVHSTTACHTCYPTTAFYWYVEFSGADEAEIVENAADRACTICYPTAPVDRPTTMYTPDEKQAKVEAEARAAAKIEREAKRIAKAPTASGEALIVPAAYGNYTEELRTEVTARQEWNRAEDLKTYGSYDVARLGHIQEIIETALAGKHGVSVEAMRTELVLKYKKNR